MNNVKHNLYKKKDGFQNETIWKLVTENPKIEVNEHKKELVIPIR